MMRNHAHRLMLSLGLLGLALTSYGVVACSVEEGSSVHRDSMLGCSAVARDLPARGGARGLPDAEVCGRAPPDRGGGGTRWRRC